MDGPADDRWYEDPHRYHQEAAAAAQRLINADGWVRRFAPFLVPVLLLVLASVPQVGAFDSWFGIPGLVALVVAFWWHFTRQNRVIRRIIRLRLCFGCGYALTNAVVTDGAGVCPECGRAYLLAHYGPPTRGYQQHRLDDVIETRET